MNYFEEYALLVAVAIPVIAIVGLNVYLWSEGERGTLLVPSSQALPKLIDLDQPMEEPVPIGYEAAPATTSADRPRGAFAANDTHERQVA